MFYSNAAQKISVLKTFSFPFLLICIVYFIKPLLVTLGPGLQWLACSFAKLAWVKVPGTRTTENHALVVFTGREPQCWYLCWFVKTFFGSLHLMFSYTLIKSTEWSQHVGKPPGSMQQCLILPAPRVWTNGHLLGFPTRSHGNCSFLWLWKGCGDWLRPSGGVPDYWWAGLCSSQRVFSFYWRWPCTSQGYG